MSGRIPRRIAQLTSALLATTAVLAISVGAASASELLYSNFPAKPLPANLPSVPFEASGVSEFGGLVKFGEGSHGFTDRGKASVEVGMSSWQCQSGTWFEDNCVSSMGAKEPSEIPITLNVYEVGELSKPLWSTTKSFKIPYRPSASAKCTGAEAGDWYDPKTKECAHGKLFAIRFSLSKAMKGERVPAEAIISVAFNTTDYGYSPTHEPGDPADNLNVATSALSPEAMELGFDPSPGDAYITDAFASEYCGSGVTPGTFGVSTGCWTGFQPALAVTGRSS